MRPRGRETPCFNSKAMFDKKAYSKAYYERNREARKAYQRARYAARSEQEKAYQKEYRARRKAELKAQRDAKYAANPEPARARQRLYSRRKSGMLNATDETRSGPCEVCLVEYDSLHLDHDHVTGIIRVWLCSVCNRAIGLLKDNPETMRRAAEYVEKERSNEQCNREADDGEGCVGDVEQRGRPRAA